MSAPTRAIGYVRVSTGDQGESGHGLRAQEAAIQAACALRGWELVGVREEVKSGARADNRPLLGDVLASLRRGDADAVVVAKLDRLSRSVVDAGRLLEEARKRGFNIVALDLGLDLSTPTGELVANVLAAVAQSERRMIGQRTSGVGPSMRSEVTRGTVALGILSPNGGANHPTLPLGHSWARRVQKLDRARPRGARPPWPLRSLAPHGEGRA